MNDQSKLDRRQFFKYSAAAAASLVLAPLFKLRSSLAFGADLPMLTAAANPMAKTLNYVADAHKAPADKRKDKTSKCGNCQFYTDKTQKTAGPCQIFQGYRVAASGWCSSWNLDPTLKK